jgi:hypothetical protein
VETGRYSWVDSGRRDVGNVHGGARYLRGQRFVDAHRWKSLGEFACSESDRM